MSKKMIKCSPALPILGLALMLGACTDVNGPTGAMSGPENQIQIKSTRLTDCAEEVLSLKLLGQRSSQFSTEIVSPGAFMHQYKVITIDTTGLNSGTLSISWTLGNRSQGSFALMGASPAYPCSGDGEPSLKEATNQEPGSRFDLSHTFTQGQVFRLLTEGSWQDPKDTTNTVNWTIQVNP